MRSLKSILGLLLVAAPFSVFAHDGHGVFNGSEIAHYVTSPGHAIPMLAIVVIAVIVIRHARKSARG